MTNSLRTLRWILTPISGFLAFYIGLSLGFLAISFLDNFCPAEQIISGMCTAKWYLRTEDIIIPFTAGLIAVLVVLLPTLIAPAHRHKIAVLAFIAGAIAVVWMGRQDLLGILRNPASRSSWMLSLPIFSALAAGWVTVLLLQKRLSH